MFANYLTIAFRNLAKYKVFSIINITGMAVSLGSCILIALFVWDEMAFDQHHPDGDRTYRIYNIRTGNDGVTNYLPIVPYPFAGYMQKDFPEIESSLRMLDTYGEQLFQIGDTKTMESGGMLVEPTVFDMLTIQVTEGDAKTALVKPQSVALSQSLAKKYFGNASALGQQLKIDDIEWQVTAVFADVPQHFHLKLNYLTSLSTTQWSTHFENNWQRQQIFTYIKLKPGTDAKALEAKFPAFVQKYAGELFKEKGFSYVPYLQNIKDIHLHSSNFEWEVAVRGNAQSVYILSATGIMVLIIACLNFINLSTARAVKRMKEVGVRKVVGAQKRQLVFQFIAESVLLTLIGLAIALMLAESALPIVNNTLGKTLALKFEPTMVAGALGLCLVIGVLAGSYPALYLSRQKPSQVLNRKNETQTGGAWMRQSLVVLQFMLSFFLIIGSWTVLSQNDLLQNKNLGFDKEQVVVVPLTSAQLRNQETTKRAYMNNTNVIGATIGFGLPGDIIAGDDVIDPVDGKTLQANVFCVDHDYITTMGMKIVAGRDFSTSFPSDTVDAFILSETAIATYGFGTPEEAIGRRIDWTRWDTQQPKQGKIIGVVQDFHFKSLREKISPAVLHIFPKQAWKMAVRIRPEHMDETIAHLKATFEQLEQTSVFSYNFLDENFDKMYQSEERLSKLFTFFTYLAIVVACLGLYGLVEYSVNQRAKEISIRKVFGASVASLLLLLTRKYFMLLAISFVLIVPLSIYFAQEWLSGFAYHIELGPGLFVKAILMILGVTVFTVSFQSIKAALSNPAHVLKND